MPSATEPVYDEVVRCNSLPRLVSVRFRDLSLPPPREEKQDPCDELAFDHNKGHDHVPCLFLEKRQSKSTILPNSLDPSPPETVT